jgi:cytochrome o ubiquinol oxidase subunit I
VTFWFTLIGFYVTFIPLYSAGVLGMTRRMQHYDVAEWRPWMIAAGIGMVLMSVGVIFQILQLVVSIRHRAELRDVTGDPWDGRSLEWATSSPPPVFNFAVMPNVTGEDAYWTIKSKARRQNLEVREPDYRDIEMPRNSPTGFVCAFFATVMGFALIWHIWWMVILGLVGAFATFVVFAWRDHDEYVIPANEVARIDRANLAERRAATNFAESPA